MVKISWIILVLAIVFSLIWCWWLGVRMYHSIQFDHQCEAYLKRAADADTVEIAKENLKNAIDYAEENNLTKGIVSVFFLNPKNVIYFIWGWLSFILAFVLWCVVGAIWDY